MLRFVFVFLALLVPTALGVAFAEDGDGERPQKAEESERKGEVSKDDEPAKVCDDGGEAMNAAPKKGDTAKRKKGPFDAALLKAAADYADWSEVDNEARWAPELCRMPMPAAARMSQAKEKTAHARKIYFLFAKDRGAYLKASAKKPEAQPVGQILVKEAHAPVVVDKMPPYRDRIREGAAAYKQKDKEKEPRLSRFLLGARDPYVRDGEKVYRAGKRNGLFLMMKVDPKTQQSDEGWIYATINPQTNQITAAGRLQSCMKCHQDAPKDRMFGLPRRVFEK